MRIASCALKLVVRTLHRLSSITITKAFALVSFHVSILIPALLINDSHF